MRTFLTAEWRHLLLVNYVVDPGILLRRLPSGVELDFWNSEALVSMVGFLFLRTRVLGVPVPMHVNFEEVNLRFYVRKRCDGEWRRGVVFVKEIVPRSAIAAVARLCFEEPYVAMPMRHRLGDGSNGVVEYSWKFRGDWNFLRATRSGEWGALKPGSLEEFITEHYWGYTVRSSGACSEYEVQHPPWLVAPVSDPVLHCNIAGLYGQEFVEPLTRPCHSAFVAAGSPVRVGRSAPA